MQETTFIPRNIKGRSEDFEQMVKDSIYRHIGNDTSIGLLANMPDPELPLLISFSGGRTSALMAYIIMTHPAFKSYKKVCVFANTGKELEQTLEFVKKCDEAFDLNCVWIESEVFHGKRKASGHKIVDFEKACRTGKPFEEVIKKYGIPNQAFPHCTRELKLNPIKSYMRSLGYDRWTNAIGLRFDEQRRISTEKQQRDQKRPNFYLLSHLGVTAPIVQRFWSMMGFDLGLKSYQGNCDLCWKKSLKKKLRILKENPEIGTWYIDMEEKYGQEDEMFISGSHVDLIELTFHRNGQSTKEMLEISKGDIETFEDPYDGNEIGCACNVGEQVEPEEEETEMDKFVKEMGFESEKEFHKMVSSVDLTKNMKAFLNWKEEDGTKIGLEKLLI